MDLFGYDGGVEPSPCLVGGVELPNIPEYSKSELTRMEREVTGLYLSGHPMDDFRDAVKRLGAVSIGDVLVDFSKSPDNAAGSTSDKARFRDDQKVVLAGVIEAVKTKPTRNNSLMAYLTLDDGTGSIELLAFQKVIDNSGGYMQIESLVIAYGKISDRDDKDPQIVLDALRPVSDAERLTAPKQGVGSREQGIGNREQETGLEQRTLFVKLRSEDSQEYERLKLVHMMFPGNERMVIHFDDIKKNVGAKCMIHEALLEELKSMLGDENVKVR
jgi:DNA polymerase-3 subunit alpha